MEMSSWASFPWWLRDPCFTSLWPSDAILRHRSEWTMIGSGSRYQNQCWLVIKGVLWHSHESNFTRSLINSISGMCLEIMIKITKTFLICQWVDIMIDTTPFVPMLLHYSTQISNRFNSCLVCMILYFVCANLTRHIITAAFFLHILNQYIALTWDPFYLHGLSLIPAWKSNNIHYKARSEITNPFPNFKEMNR